VIDKKWIGHEQTPAVFALERSRMQFFAKAIGETDPVYTDLAVAKKAGYADIPALPTFLFSAELDSGTLLGVLDDLEIPIAKLLHGEQSFTYHRAACAGDTVTLRSKITDIYDKKGGALEFVVKTSRVTNQHDELVAELRAVLVCRH
jgi:acyl dehydratase